MVNGKGQIVETEPRHRLLFTIHHLPFTVLNMPQITRDSLMTLEAYAKARPEFRARVIAHKKNRVLHLGGNVTLIFEDELTIRYQVQEMLRAERIFEAEGIEDELGAYNPLVPDGSNWKATMMIEYPDLDERRQKLEKLIGVEDKVWVKVEGHQRVYAIAMRIWTAKLPKRPRRSISCASSSIARWWMRSSAALRFPPDRPSTIQRHSR